MPGESEIEIRQVFEADDFGAEFTPEMKAQEERLRAEAAKKKYRRLAQRSDAGTKQTHAGEF